MAVLLFFAVGLIFLVFCGYWLISIKNKLTRFHLIPCTVVGYKKFKLWSIGSYTLNYSYAPKVEYIGILSREKKQYTDKWFMPCWRRFKIGKSIEIFIDPQGKDEPILNSFLSKYSGIIVVGFIGALFVWSPIAFWLGRKNFITP
jgi:hypothetical protein